MRSKLPSQWAAAGVLLIENNWRPVLGDDMDTYTPQDGKVHAVIQAVDGNKVTFNFVRRHRDHTREVVVLTYTVRYERRI